LALSRPSGKKNCDPARVIDYCLTYPDVYEDYPFDELTGVPDAWAVMRHKGNKKSFAFIYERSGLCVNLKCEPLRADFLRQIYPGVTPACHMNKEHWTPSAPTKCRRTRYTT